MAFGGFRAVAAADLAVDEGEIVGLIGPNGAGKSTFFNCLSGDLVPSAGAVTFDGADLTRASPEEHARRGIGRTFQVPATFADMTVLENVMVGAFLRHPQHRAARAEALRLLELTELPAPCGAAGARPRHRRPQAPRDRARARHRPAPAAARRGAGRPQPGRDPARDRAGPRDPRDRDHPGRGRAHHGGDREPDPARAGLQPGPRDRRGRAAGVMTDPAVIEAYLGRSRSGERRRRRTPR